MLSRIPSSYWYMQNFDIVNLVKVVDWFNVMTYDLHGTWYVDFVKLFAQVVAYAHLGIRQTSSLVPSSMPIQILPRLIKLWICFGAIRYCSFVSSSSVLCSQVC